MENINVVTGLGLGCTRIVKRPGFDEPPEPKDQIEVEIVGVDIHDTRIGFDAVELDRGVLNGLNRRFLHRYARNARVCAARPPLGAKVR